VKSDLSKFRSHMINIQTWNSFTQVSYKWSICSSGAKAPFFHYVFKAI